MGTTSPVLPGQDPAIAKTTVFGRITQMLRSWLPGDTTPLQMSFSTDAEARGFGDSPYDPPTSSISGYAYDRMRVEAGRYAAYRDYDLMDAEQPECSAALDVISEFATQSDDPKSKTFNISSDDKDFATYLTGRIEELKIDKMTTPTCREIAKYGTAFWELVADTNFRISKVKPLPPHQMIRNETPYGDLMEEAFSQLDPKTNQVVARFAAWQICQGRYQRMNNRLYGNSILEPGRPVYKKLQLMEDGLVIGRLYRSHMRFVIQIPVDGMNANDAETYLEKIKKKFRKRVRYNPSTQKQEGFDAPIAADDDFFIAVRKEGINSDVKTVQGQGELDKIADIEYFQNKLFAVLAVPKAVLGFERDVNAKATLTEQDINFARRLLRMQQVMTDMIVHALNIVMILDGYDPETVPDWSVVFPPVSTTDQLRKWQTEALKANVALVYGQKLPVVDMEYIWKELMGLSQDEIERLTALDPDDFGVQTMPPPPFENVGVLADEFPDQPPQQPGGAGGAPRQQSDAPTDAKESAIDFINAGNFNVVKEIRKRIKLAGDEPVTEGELKLVTLLRDFQETFGPGVISKKALESAFEKAKAKN